MSQARCYQGNPLAWRHPLWVGAYMKCVLSTWLQVGNAIKSSLHGAALKSNNKEGARSIQVEITPTSSRISRNAVTSLSIRGHRWKRHGKAHWHGSVLQPDYVWFLCMYPMSHNPFNFLVKGERATGLNLYTLQSPPPFISCPTVTVLSFLSPRAHNWCLLCPLLFENHPVGCD